MRMKPHAEWGDLFELVVFLAACRDHSFIDYDGFGHWATATEQDADSHVTPSKVKDGQQVPPAWATHVMWFNR